jgi:hypothetical protein
LEKLGSAFSPKAPTETVQSSEPLLASGGQVHGGAGMAGPSAQLMSNILAQSAKPLSWSTAPYGSGMAGPQGLTLSSNPYG